MLDGKGAEGVHRDVSRAHHHAPSSRFPYWAAAVRLDQNIELYNRFEEAGHLERFETAWFLHKSILQKPRVGGDGVRRRAKTRNCRMPEPEFLARVYRLFPHNLHDFKWLQPGLHAGDAPQEKRVLSELSAIKLDFVKGAFLPKDVISVPMQGSVALGNHALQPNEQLKLFQIVDATPARKKLPFKKDWTAYKAPMYIQELIIDDAHLPKTTDGSFEQDACIKCSIASPPVIVDVMRLCPPEKLTTQLHFWELKEAEPAVYHKPALPQSKEWTYMDEHYPVYLMIKHLTAQGWRTASLTEPMRRDGPKTMDRDAPVSRKSYYRCLYQLDSLFDKGLVELHVKQNEWYYKCILRVSNPAAVAPDLLVRQYKALLKGKTTEAPVNPRYNWDEDPQDSDVEAVDEEEPVDDDNEDAVGLLHSEAVPFHDNDDNQVPADNSDSSSSASAPVVGSKVLPETRYVEGQRIYEGHHDPTSPSGYRRIYIYCPHESHMGGSKPCRK